MTKPLTLKAFNEFIEELSRQRPRVIYTEWSCGRRHSGWVTPDGYPRLQEWHDERHPECGGKVELIG